MIQDTSRLAYFTDIQPRLGEKQREVYRALEQGETMTNLEIATKLGIPINCTTPRVLELRKMGLVFKEGTRRCKESGRLAIVWSAKKDTLF